VYKSLPNPLDWRIIAKGGMSCQMAGEAAARPPKTYRSSGELYFDSSGSPCSASVTRPALA
jgi:hypothetical protein